MRDIARAYMHGTFQKLDQGRDEQGGKGGKGGRRGSKMGGSVTQRSLETPAKRLTKALQRLDAKKAQATVPEDGRKIKEKIVETCGSIPEFNIRLQTALNGTLAGQPAP